MDKELQNDKSARNEKIKENEEPVPTNAQQIFEIEVPHVQQFYHWDCGLACVSMILQMFGKPADEVYTKDLEYLQCGQSVWTIDLSYILNRHHISALYFTTVIGVNETHHNKVFYKQSIVKDNIRVNKLFDNAAQNGIKVQKGNVSMKDIVSHLSKDNPIIVLVDWSKMACGSCDSKMKACWSCLTCGSPPYHGHYIVVCGYDKEKSIIHFRNPDGKNEMCCVSMAEFDRARSSDGTDDDIVLIFRPSKYGTEGSQGDSNFQHSTSMQS